MSDIAAQEEELKEFKLQVGRKLPTRVNSPLTCR
jgi:hypothetical protein